MSEDNSWRQVLSDSWLPLASSSPLCCAPSTVVFTDSNSTLYGHHPLIAGLMVRDRNTCCHHPTGLQKPSSKPSDSYRFPALCYTAGVFLCSIIRNVKMYKNPTVTQQQSLFVFYSVFKYFRAKPGFAWLNNHPRLTSDCCFFCEKE